MLDAPQTTRSQADKRMVMKKALVAWLMATPQIFAVVQEYANLGAGTFVQTLPDNSTQEYVIPGVGKSERTESVDSPDTPPRAEIIDLVAELLLDLLDWGRADHGFRQYTDANPAFMKGSFNTPVDPLDLVKVSDPAMQAKCRKLFALINNIPVDGKGYPLA